MDDLAVIVVSTNEADWLRACLPTVFASAGDLDLDVVVVDNGAGDGTRELVEAAFPGARVVASDNHGFPHANNRALMTIDARHVLFLNPDTEIVEGSLADLVGRMDANPEIGLAGCRQVAADGSLWPSMRRFPTAMGALGEALLSERWPWRPAWAGMRELHLDRYAGEFDLDWTSGSFMLVRREALESAGWMDERMFLYSDEVDLAFRIKQAGWSVRHLPQMQIIHHAGKMGFNVRGYAQFAYAHRVYARKHLSPLHRAAFAGALATNYGLRAVGFRLLGSDPDAPKAMRRALRVILGRDGAAPYEPPPVMAVRPRRLTRGRSEA
jgi:GT2 family glycosyltransferase